MKLEEALRRAKTECEGVHLVGLSWPFGGTKKVLIPKEALDSEDWCITINSHDPEFAQAVQDLHGILSGKGLPQ